jgi:hypothetical protein
MYVDLLGDYSDKSTKTGEGAAIKHQREIQDKLSSDMVKMVQNLKNNALMVEQILKKDETVSIVEAFNKDFGE